MPKPQLSPEMSAIEHEIIETLIAGLHEWRSDLSYPESYSDMQACVRGLLKMFDIKRLPLPRKLLIKCYECEGIGQFIQLKEGYRELTNCIKCHGRGSLDGE